MGDFDVTIVGDHDQGTIEQLERCLAIEEGSRGALMPDGHLGYSMPIGGVIGYRNLVSPSGVGYDIGCGNKAVLTDLDAADVEDDMPAIMDEIVRRVSFGMGQSNRERVGHAVLDEIARAEDPDQRALAQNAGAQLGTVGAGNHYVDVFRDELDQVWVGVHFGSRGFGHKTADKYIRLAYEDMGQRAIKVDVNGMHATPAVLQADSDLGQSYVEAMELAGRYAYAGRDVVCAKVLEILGARELDSVHNHHNFAWLEEHDGELLWVVRKGATPAYPGQRGFVGSTMGEQSVILEGASAGGRELLDSQGRHLFSTVHGAGRAMSRTKAAGKVRRRKRYACMDRDCSRVFDIDGVSAHNGLPKSGVCPDHPKARVKKVWIEEVKQAGLIDYDEVRREMAARNIELRGGAADEAPGAYKRLDEVLPALGGTIDVLHVLTPMGVAMAGPDIKDDYRD